MNKDEDEDNLLLCLILAIIVTFGVYVVPFLLGWLYDLGIIPWSF